MTEAKHLPVGRAALPRWANNHDGWCRTIAADVLKNRVQPSGLDIERYLKVLLSEKKLSTEPFQGIPMIEEKEFDANPLEPVCLDSVKIEEGVNALKSGSEIAFAPGVTVIFGENGAGKSGFVRVLKRAAGVRTAEDILPNIHTANRPTPSGRFTATIGATAQTIQWKNEFGIAPLNRVSIFDARGARLHLEDDLTYVYTPGELTLFPLVQNAVEQIRAALDGVITATTPSANAILTSFDRSASIYPVIETLGAATDLDEIRKYAVLPENIDAMIDSLAIEVGALKSSNIQNELKRARDRIAVVKAVKMVIDKAKAFDQATYASYVVMLSEAAKYATKPAAWLLKDWAFLGFLGNEWRQFIQAGEDYLQQTAATTYPTVEDSCVYCQQPLTSKAVILIKKYRDFSSNEIKAALDRAERRLRDYVAPLVGLNVEAVYLQLSAETNGTSDLLEPVCAVVAKIKDLKLAVTSRSTIEWGSEAESIDAARILLSGEETRLTILIASLQASVSERESALKRKQTELIELQAQKTTSTLLPQIEKRVIDAKWVARATIVRNNFTGLLRSLTEAAKDASEELLNKDFEKRFDQECRRLRAPNVTLNFPGRHGRSTGEKARRLLQTK